MRIPTARRPKKSINSLANFLSRITNLRVCLTIYCRPRPFLTLCTWALVVFCTGSITFDNAIVLKNGNANPTSGSHPNWNDTKSFSAPSRSFLDPSFRARSPATLWTVDGLTSITISTSTVGCGPSFNGRLSLSGRSIFNFRLKNYELFWMNNYFNFSDWQDYLTYWHHRMYHTPWLYKHFHKLHHTYKQPTAFSVTAIHPVEFLHMQCVLISPMFLVPTHWGMHGQHQYLVSIK